MLLLLLTAVLSLRIAAQRTTSVEPSLDWPQFGYDAASSNASAAGTGIDAANLASLSHRQVNLGGTVDASAIYLRSVNVAGSLHDTFFVTTTYGKTLAIDADSGAILWQFTPASYSSLVGTAQITTSTPAADPNREFIYAAAPDGTIQKPLAVADGHAVVWSTSITLLPSKEKIASPIKVANDHVIAVTGGYDGDAPPYQGHVAVLDAQNGTLLSVWNSLCSGQAGLIAPFLVHLDAFRDLGPRGRIDRPRYRQHIRVNRKRTLRWQGRLGRCSRRTRSQRHQGARKLYAGR